MNSFNGTQHTTTFVGGMNMDLDNSVLPANTYRYGENVRLITNTDGTSGTLQAIEGFDKLNLSDLIYTYYKYDVDTDTIITESAVFSEEIIGVAVIRDYTAIFTKDADGINSIFRMIIDSDDVELTRVAHGEFNINGGEKRDMSITTRWEDFDNIKVYWADGVNSLRSINIAESHDLINFNQPISEFDNTMSIVLSQPEVVSIVSGNLKAGVVQYAYRMFNVNGGESEISPLTNLLHLTDSNVLDTNYKGASPGTSTGKGCVLRFKVNGGRRCRIYRIQYESLVEDPTVQIVTEFDIPATTITEDIYQTYTDVGNFLSEISLEEFIMSSSYAFIPKVIESKDSHLFAGDIIEKTWNLPSFEEDGWYDTRAFRFGYNNVDLYHAKVESVTEDFKIISYEAIMDLSDDEWKKFLPYNHDCINPFNHKATGDHKSPNDYEWYYDNTQQFTHKGGIGRNVSFKIVHTKFGEDWLESNDIPYSEWASYRSNILAGHARNITINDKPFISSSSELPIWYNMPSSQSSSFEKPDFYVKEATDVFRYGQSNYSNPFLSGKYRSYQRDEIYRFAVVFRNKSGQATPASWICDIRMPHMTESAHRLFDQHSRIQVDRNSTDMDVYQVVTYPMGLEFTFRNLPEDVEQIEIVRSKRERSNRRHLCQGLIGRLPHWTANDKLRPTGILNYLERTAFYSQHASYYSEDSYSTTTPAQTPTNHGNIDFYNVVSPEISYFRDALEWSPRDVRNVQILHGVSSPTVFPSIFNYTAAQKVYRHFIHTFNASQWWWPRSLGSTAEHIFTYLSLYSDGQASNRSGGLPTLHSSMTYRPQNDPVRFQEWLSNYVGKMYSPFNTYTGRHTPEVTLQHNDHRAYGVEDAIFTDGIRYDQWRAVAFQNAHIQEVGGASYQNWVFDEYCINTGANLNNMFTKHGSFAPSLVLHLPSMNAYKADGLDYINGVGTERRSGGKVYSKYFGNDNFFINPGVPGVYPDLNNHYIDTADERSRAYAINATFLVNLSQNPDYYGGDDFNGRSNSTYVSTNVVMQNNASNARAVVFGGDTFIGLAEQVLQHWYWDSEDPLQTHNRDYMGRRGQITVVYPCESSINLSLTHGALLSTYTKGLTPPDANRGPLIPYSLQLDPYVSPDGFNQAVPLYAYNSVYSTEPRAKLFIPRGVYTEDNKRFDYRLIYSDAKQNDEISDSWLHFRAANYYDVDTRFGSINNLKQFNNTLYFWQNNAFGAVSVNPRSLITDNNMGALLLGKGDTIAGHQYLTQANGSRNNVINNVVTSPSSLYWYDHDRAELLSMGQGLSALSKTRGVQSWFNKHKHNIDDQMVTVHNKQYNEIQFAFRLKDGSEPSQLVYGETANAFTSFHTYNPDWFVDLQSTHYSFKNNSVYRHNSNPLVNKFYNNQEPSKFTSVVNASYSNTKVFDNVNYYAEFNKDNNLSFEFSTTTQQSYPKVASDVDLREDTYKFAIPRSKEIGSSGSALAPTYTSRMKGKFLYIDAMFNPNAGDTVFKIPYLNTAFRLSNI